VLLAIIHLIYIRETPFYLLLQYVHFLHSAEATKDFSVSQVPAHLPVSTVHHSRKSEQCSLMLQLCGSRAVSLGGAKVELSKCWRLLEG